MNSTFKKLCILGSSAAFGIWGCNDTSSTAADDPIESSASEIIAESSSSVEIFGSSSSDANIDPALSSSSAVLIESSSSEIIAGSSSSAETLKSSSSSASTDPALSSSSATLIESSSSAIIKGSSSSAETLKSSSSSASTDPVQSSSSAALIESSSSAFTKSIGCGKTTNIQTGYSTISINGTSRKYAIDIPANYDSNKPYRLFYTSHWYGGKADDVVNGSVSNGGAVWAFFGLKNIANKTGEQAIFIAPSMNGATWDLSGSGSDHALFTSLLTYAKENLCIDEDRVFAVGFSFGAMMSYSLSLTHQDDLRAVATLAATNYVGSANSPWVPYPADTQKKIAYLGITGMSDGTCPFIGNQSKSLGGFYAASIHAKNNGCTVPSDPNTIDKTYAGSKTHVVYDFKNCNADYPVRYITFDGGHIAAPTDGQTSDDGAKTWAPQAMWDFFGQF